MNDLPGPSLTLEELLTIFFQTDKARAELVKAEGKFDQYRKDGLEKIDAADRKIEAEAAKAKSGISSWFGGK